jgi:NADH:ubiquinone oxidoreductase subunit F (NADH-binding)
MKALEYYRGPEKYNCAQAIVKAFDRDDLVTEMKKNGGGRAKDGLCGALHAALEITDADKKECVMKSFEQETGALKCSALRANRIPCTKCVMIAEKLLKN